MLKLLIVPDADGYNSVDGETVIRTGLDGGAARYRQDKLGASKMVSLKWTLNPQQYEYWRAFYVTGTKQGALAFLCDLVSENGRGPVEHVCNFIPGSVSLPTQQGYTYVQQAQLEVKPLVHNTQTDMSIIYLYGVTGGQTDSWINRLDHLVNVTAPAALHV